MTRSNQGVATARFEQRPAARTNRDQGFGDEKQGMTWNDTNRGEEQARGRSDGAPEKKSVVPVRIEHRTLRFATAGRLLPWLGPALRGLASGTLKRRVCVFSAAEQRTRWLRCRGCPHLLSCPHGVTFEYDPPGGCLVTSELRPLTLVPHFPAPSRVKPGDYLTLRVMLIGRRAMGMLDHVTTALEEAAQHDGLGPDHVCFGCQAAPAHTTLEAGVHTLDIERLPVTVPVSGDTIPRVELALESPLFLKRKANRDPAFDELFRAALRIVGRVAAAFAGPLEGRVDFETLKARAAEVQAVHGRWHAFRQQRWSNRTQQRYQLSGLSGRAVFADVPVELLPWLIWGGRLGVGKNRVAGAGVWRIHCA